MAKYFQSSFIFRRRNRIRKFLFHKHVKTPFVSRLIIFLYWPSIFLSLSLHQHGEPKQQPQSQQPTDAWTLALAVSLPALIAQTINALQTPPSPSQSQSQLQSQLNAAEWRAAAANTIGSLVYFVGPQVGVGAYFVFLLVSSSQN